MIHLGDKTYRIVHEYKDAWNPEAFRDRYSEVLDRYDYIMGDWGYSQLRLKGFFKDDNVKANKESTIAGLQDYLNEYCNFGCAYFVLERIPNPNRPLDKEHDSREGSMESDAESPETAEETESFKRNGLDGSSSRSERPEHREYRHRFDPGTRKEPIAPADIPARNDQSQRNLQNKPDHANRGGTPHHRGKDRNYRGGGGRPDKPFENRPADSRPNGSQRDGNPRSGKTPVG